MTIGNMDRTFVATLAYCLLMAAAVQAQPQSAPEAESNPTVLPEQGDRPALEVGEQEVSTATEAETDPSSTITQREEPTVERGDSANDPESVTATVSQTETPGDVSDTPTADIDATVAANLELALAQQEAEAVDRARLDFYGFADFGMEHAFIDEGSSWEPWHSDKDSFFIGNLNLFMDAYLSQFARSLIEIRFLFQPQNVRDSGGNRMGIAPDQADRNRNLKFGSIEIERAWVEYNLHNLLTIRLGQWLTPYGIWNVDHGSPTIISIGRPYVIGMAFMPERQTGLQIYGDQTLGSTLSAGYHLTLSNGRGPLDSFMDLDDNKAIGGRVFAELEAAGRWQLGGSIYYGRYADDEGDKASVSQTDITRSFSMKSQYDELTLAADLQWNPGPFHLQAEIINNQRVFTENGRYLIMGEEFQDDRVAWGTYVLIGYRLPWLDLMPYAYLEYYYPNEIEFFQKAYIWAGGLNWQILPALIAKGQFLFAAAIDEPLFQEDLKAIQFQISWAF